MKRRNLLFQLSASFVLLASWSTFGADAFWNFDLGGNPATGDPFQDPSFLTFGNNVFSDWNSVGGNPDTGGYLSLCNGYYGQNLAIVFPVVDPYTNLDGSVIGLPINAFSIDLDVRLGNGNPEHGADGFSVNFVRAEDQVLLNATNNVNQGTYYLFEGFAGGDSDAEAALLIPTSGDAENGTRTGLSVCFDTWQGNYLPRNGVLANTPPGTPNDTEGVEVRFNDVTLFQLPMTNLDGSFDRNGNCTANIDTVVPPGTLPYPDCAAAACADQNTIQTGPWTGGDGDPSVLCWQPLHIELNAQKQITVVWKRHTVVDHLPLASYNLSPGRLVLAARSGGYAENIHVDNVHVITVPDYKAFLQTIQPAGPDGLYGFSLIFQGVGPSIVQKLTSLQMDGNANLAPLATLVANGEVTTATYLGATRLSPGAHSVQATVRTTLGQTITFNASFNVADWIEVPTDGVVPLASVSQPGFRVKSYQTLWVQPEPNHNYWADEQLEGFHGPNLADQTFAVNGAFSFNGAVDLSYAQYANSFFTIYGYPNQGYDFGFDLFGIPGPNATDFYGYYLVGDNSALELNAYVYFPSNGVYHVFVGSDDGFRLTTARNPSDRIGTTLMQFDGGRGISTTFPATSREATSRLLIINQPGAYPMRLLWENGAGGYGLEWYIRYGDTYILVNDDGSYTGLISPVKAFQVASAAPPYVKTAIPVKDALNVPLDQNIDIQLADGTSQVDPRNVLLKLDGTARQVSKTKTGDTTHIVYSPQALWTPGSAHTIQLTFQDRTGPPFTEVWSFTIETNVAFPFVQLPADWGVSTAQIDHTLPGFRVLSYQTLERQTNSIQWTEEQFLGLHGPNIADQSGAIYNGEFYWPYVVDFTFYYGWSSAGFPYNFDLGSLGIQPNPFGPDNSSAIFFGWVEFPAPGVYTMEVNSDDGFSLMAFPGQQVLARILSGQGFPLTAAPLQPPLNPPGKLISYYNGGRPAAGTYGGTKVDLYIAKAGAYPFRLLWENGALSSAVEWSIWQRFPDGSYQDLLINETHVPGAIQAYAYPNPPGNP